MGSALAFLGAAPFPPGGALAFFVAAVPGEDPAPLPAPGPGPALRRPLPAPPGEAPARAPPPPPRTRSSTPSSPPLERRLSARHT